MDLTVAVAGDAPADDLHSLRGWLDEEAALPDRVRLIESPPAPGELGISPEMLQIILGTGSTVFVTSLLAWLRTRVGAVRVVMRTRSGSAIELDARTVRALDAAGLAELTRELRGALEDGDGER